LPFCCDQENRNGKAWAEWENGLRNSNPREIDRMKKEFHDDLEGRNFSSTFFQAMVFLKKYCNDKGIRLIGDIPIYVNYDSVDVWTHADLFKLDKYKNPTSVAGVPPDYFSKTGQLWEIRSIAGTSLRKRGIGGGFSGLATTFFF
jgi:4-alpha-glucanotransferase